MGFLRVFLRLFFGILILGGAGFLIAREAILYWSAAQVVRDAQALARPAKYQDRLRGCLGAQAGGDVYDGVQLRFLDQNSYVLEIRCLQIKPVVWGESELFPGVQKKTGSAGFFYDRLATTLSGEITLELWGQAKTVAIVNERPRQSWGKTDVQSSVVTSTCLAHGKVCCSPVDEMGEGDVLSAGVSDCPGECYQSCRRRPLLLSFQTDPAADYTASTVSLTGTSGLVLFSFTYDDSQSPVTEVTLDFGDGTSETFSSRTGQATKEYQCASFPCEFIAQVRATDQRGIVSAPSRISQLKIVFTP